MLIRATTQAVRSWLLATHSCVQFRVTSGEIRGGRSGGGPGFYPSCFRSSLLIAIPPMAQPHISPTP
jgi:hypothetical protein